MCKVQSQVVFSVILKNSVYLEIKLSVITDKANSSTCEFNDNTFTSSNILNLSARNRHSYTKQLKWLTV